MQEEADAILIDASDLPRELKRRLLLTAFAELGMPQPRGPELMRAMDKMDSGETATLAGLKLEGGSVWRLSPAPPRRR
jgi:tRNA(Ile)-lysidine synthase